MNGTNERKEWRDPMFGKMMVVGVLILALLIPLGWISGIVWERQARHEEVRRELSATWGGEQVVQGPILTVPFVERRRDDKGKETVWRHRAFFLPETLEIDGVVEPERRSRGLFQVLLYRVRLRIQGSFGDPDFGVRKVENTDVLWREAALSIGIPDLRGVQSDPVIRWDDAPLAFRPGPGPITLYPSGMHALVPALETPAAKPHRFQFELTLTGADALRFVPVGKDNRVTLGSAWPDPSFDGAFLPVERTVSPTGFDATWRVSYYARSYPQAWRSDEPGSAPSADSIATSAFGVRLIESVNFYSKTDRSLKYAMLFLSLTFLTFLLFEVLAGLRVHPLPYLLVGLALCLFYVLLLSLSEHLGFGVAYSLASGATIALIAGYARKLLCGGARSAILASGLAGLYGYLYVLLQLEDYALLLGSLGLFSVLATVMWVTRNVDWYAIGSRRALSPEPAQ